MKINNEDKQRKNRKRKKRVLSFAIVSVLLIVLIFISANVGSLKVTIPQMFSGLFLKYDPDVTTVFDLRFPRIVISVLAGAAVAVAGVLFQAVLKNPLADPGIIGISGGASCVSACILCVAPGLLTLTPLFACFGGIVAFALVYALSWKGGLRPMRIILVGVAVSSFFGGVSNALNSISGSTSTVANIVEGNISQKTWADMRTLLPYVIVGLILAVLLSGSCNLLSLEDKTARSLGVNVNRQRLIISVVAVILSSICTAVVGAISFLGLIVPHIGRILVGSDHKVLIPFSMLLGAFTFLLADTIGRSIFYPYEISAAIIMCIVGGPFFIFLIRRSKQYGE